MKIDETKLLFARVRDVKPPSCETNLSTGIDFYVPDDFNDGEPCEVAPGKDMLVPSGVKVHVPRGYVLIATEETEVASSCTAIKNAFGYVKPTETDSILKVGSGIIGEHFQGEVLLHVVNIGCVCGHIAPGTKLVKMFLVPVGCMPVCEVTETRLWEDETLLD
jgi:dUTPase